MHAYNALLWVKHHEMLSATERNLIGRRTESDRTANGIRSDGGRNPIGRRTRTVAHLGGALFSAWLCRLPEQEVHQQSNIEVTLVWM